MKITHNKVGNNVNTTDTAKSDKTDKVSAKNTGAPDAAKLLDTKSDSASTVNVSSRAQDMKKAKEIATNTPDVRADRVAELQKAIDEGRYNVGAADIADKMVDDELFYT